MDKDALITSLQKTIEQQSLMIEKLQAQLDALLRVLYGKKSEKQTKPAPQPSSQLKKSSLSPQKTTRTQQPKRKPLPDDLPRIKIRYAIPEAARHCSGCGRVKPCMGKQVTEQLDVIPAKLVVKQHIRYKYHCSCNPGDIIIANMPAQPIEKGMAASGLLADIIISKFQDALPVYRQVQRYQRYGIALADSTLGDWLQQCAFLLSPIVDAIKKDLIHSKKIHTDDTPVPVLAKHKTKKGRLWVYLTQAVNTPACAVYDYTPTRSQQGPKRFLKGYRGFLQADAYAGYDVLYQHNQIIEVGCMAHARRKFIDVINTVKAPTHAKTIVDNIAALYSIEAKVKSLNQHERYYYRKKYAKPILKQLKTRLKQLRKTTIPKTPFYHAIQYMLNHWIALTRYLAEPYLNIDNNPAERAIKPCVIGRKNWLFAGNDQGAKSAAIFYSIIETCKMNQVNTFDYLKDVLQRIPNTLQKDISTLLPYNWRRVEE